MVLASLLIASHSQVDALRLDLVEESEDCVASHDLPIEVVRLERLQLSVAIFTIDIDVLLFTEFNELRRIDILWWILKILFVLIPAVSEQISVHIRIDHT